MAMTGSWGVTGVGEKPGVEGVANCRENPGGVGGGNMVGVGAHCRAEALGWLSSSSRPPASVPCSRRWASLCTTLHCPHCSGWV